MEIVSDKASHAATRPHVYQLTGGHPALDLVNTLDWRFRETGPEELLKDYGDVVRFTAQAELISAAEARKLLRTVPESKAAKIVTAVRELREAAAEAFYAAVEGKSPSAAAVKKLEACFAEARVQQELRWDGDKLGWMLPQSGSLPSLPLWLLSLSTVGLITSEQMHLLRQCGSSECRWLFLDTSKNHTRRWCDMKICGNRMKARRFKAQHRREN